MIKLYSAYIGGQWVSQVGGEEIHVVNPATEEVIAALLPASAQDVDAAVAAARRAFPAWSATPVEERAQWLEKIAARLEERAQELTNTITAEVGMPVRFCGVVQVGGPIAAWRSYAALAREYEFERRIGHSLVVREPAGVVGCITPWNYPLHQITHKVAAALAAGCTVVLKPSEVAPINAQILAEVIHEVGLPAGVFNLVHGRGDTVGEALVAHPGVDMVSFTGSVQVGRHVAATAAATVKKVALELGGKSAAIILDDADLETAIKGVRNSCFLNSGQTCHAHTRMLVPESRYEEAKALAAKLVAELVPGDPTQPGTRLGPVVSAQQRERVLGYIRKGIESGAELVIGGLQPPAGLERGYFVQPTVFGRVAPDSVIAQEEIFGPVLCIITYKDEDEAVAIANGTIYGLGGGVWSGDPERAVAVARRLRTGQVDINGAPYNALAPFGGYRQSGVGREAGVFGLEEFLEVKAIQLPGAGKRA